MSSLISMMRAPSPEAKAFLGAGQGALALNVGGPRESEAPGIYTKAGAFLRIVLAQAWASQRPFDPFSSTQAPLDLGRQSGEANTIRKLNAEASYFVAQDGLHCALIFFDPRRPQRRNAT